MICACRNESYKTCATTSVALGAGHFPPPLGEPQKDLEVDLVVRAVDARRVVDEVGVDASAPGRVLDPRAAREAEVAALPHDAAAQLAGVDPDRVGRPVVRVPVALHGRLDHRADTAVPQQVDLSAQHRADDLVRRQSLVGEPEQLTGLGRQLDPLGVARVDAAAFGEHLARVVVPRGARRLEQPLPFLERARSIGVRVDEDMPVVVGGEQPDLVRQQHAVAEHVAGHVADPDSGELVARDVHPELAEVPLDRLPRPARSDPELLVVVADRAA
jgi:hypothetical protein